MAKVRAKAGSRKMKDSGALGGFTIIEVVLVLAIAGLIFMMVFIALPNLQRAQRDTERRDDLGTLAGQIQQYQANNNGRLPGDGDVEPADEEDTNATSMTGWCSANSNPKNGAECLIKGYLNTAGAANNTFTDPDGWTYGLKIATWTNATAQPTGMNEDGTGIDHTIYMFKKASCDGETIVPSNNSRNYVLWYKLEGNSSVCTKNS